MSVFNKILYKALPAVVCLSSAFLYACSEEKPDLPAETGGELKISAGIAKEIYTRNSNVGPVTSGDYYLSYPSVDGNVYTVATVTFGYDSANPQIGKVATADNQPFKWSLIGGSTPVFFLDNVPPVSTVGSDPMVVVFNSENTFKAGIYDSIKFTNDLLWGTVTEQRNTTGTLHFDLHHNMSRVRVSVTADPTYEIDGSLDLEGALVEISNINLNPVSYNRQDGSLTLSKSYPESYGSITLVNESVAPTAADFTAWSYSTHNEEGQPVYMSHSYVVPPQTLLDETNRPRLSITLKNGSKFTGVIPHAMEIDPPAGTETTNPYPVTLSFLKEHILTIRTVISEDPPELAFMPVKVVEWVDEGTYDLVAHQAGIYTSNEFFQMIEYYSANNTYQLQRYGPLVTTATGDKVWNFNFFSSIVIQIDSINELYGAMNPSTSEAAPYTFNFNNYPIFIRIGTNPARQVSPKELLDIMMGTSTSPF